MPKNSANRTNPRTADLPDPDEIPASVVVQASEYPAGHVIAPHRHRRAQLLYASTGVMTVTAEGGLWVVPPQRALWVPPLVEHEVRATGALSMRSVYVLP